MLRSLAWSFLGLLALSLAAPVQAQSLDVIPPPNPPRLVVDQADMLSSSEERLLEAKLNAYNDTTSTQIVVVTLPDLGGADAGQYATELGEAWGVGQGGKDNGAVILVSRDDRQIFIATGYGLEGAIPDVIASRIYRNIMVPNFREGRIYAGFNEATDALDRGGTRRVRGRGSPARRPRRRRHRRGDAVHLPHHPLLRHQRDAQRRARRRQRESGAATDVATGAGAGCRR